MDKFNFKKLDLQLFAEGEGGNPDTPPADDKPKPKYTDEDYEKLKGSFDKASSELASLKKQLKDKQTDEEKKIAEEKEKNAEVEEMRKELATLKIERKLATDFDEEEVKKLSEAIISGDVDNLTSLIVELRKAYKTKIYDEAKKEFQKSSDLPGGSGNGNDENSLGKTLANNYKRQEPKKQKWGQFENN